MYIRAIGNYPGVHQEEGRVYQIFCILQCIVEASEEYIYFVHKANKAKRERWTEEEEVKRRAFSLEGKAKEKRR